MKTAMLTSVVLSMVAAAAFTSQSSTEPAPKESAPGKSCCATAKQETPKMRCSLTGKVVDTCCCVEREGKTHCTLAGKDVAECCCTPIANEASAEDEKSASANTN